MQFLFTKNKHNLQILTQTETHTYEGFFLNLNESMNKESNIVELVKQEVIASGDVLLGLVEHEMPTIKSETIPNEDTFESPSANTFEPQVISNRSLELKLEAHDQGYYIKSESSIFIKQELLHEELEIKNEDETVQETCLDDTCNWGNELSKPNLIFSEVKRLKCSHCNYSTGSKGHLTSHLRTHTGEKPFKCNFCEYCCVENSNLKKHLRIHTGEKRFRCNICDYCCAQNSDFKRHLRSHTGEKPFKCNICVYRSTNKSHLKRHLRTHTQMKFS